MPSDVRCFRALLYAPSAASALTVPKVFGSPMRRRSASVVSRREDGWGLFFPTERPERRSAPGVAISVSQSSSMGLSTMSEA